MMLGAASVVSTAHAGDVERGAAASRQCLACHSFAPGQHLTGPSLADVWERRAGTAAGFTRYSDAMKRSDLVWNDRSLDAWLRNPAAVIPGNAMAFRGVPDAGMRADLIAYLRAVSEGQVKAPNRGLPDLKRADASHRVTGIRHCGDAYRVTTGDGATRTWWEFNLRFKTDGSAAGPEPGKPVIVGNGMQGDRAAVVFSRPAEISAFIGGECP